MPRFIVRRHRTLQVFMFRSLLSGFIATSLCANAFAQQANRLDCQGQFMQAQATVSGTRLFQATSAMGDGFVRFQGSISAGGVVGEINYQGYTNTSFPGIVRGPLGELAIGVLDNTDGRMIIYQGGAPSIWAPQAIGEFICNWQ